MRSWYLQHATNIDWNFCLSDTQFIRCFFVIAYRYLFLWIWFFLATKVQRAPMDICIMRNCSEQGNKSISGWYWVQNFQINSRCLRLLCPIPFDMYSWGTCLFTFVLACAATLPRLYLWSCLLASIAHDLLFAVEDTACDVKLHDMCFNASLMIICRLFAHDLRFSLGPLHSKRTTITTSSLWAWAVIIGSHVVPRPDKGQG